MGWGEVIKFWRECDWMRVFIIIVMFLIVRFIYAFLEAASLGFDYPGFVGIRVDEVGCCDGG
jgi:hypothetical protein